jgi:hypothetical protein
MQGQVEFFAPSEARDARLLRLYRYWLEKSGARAFPQRADLDPVDFKYILGYVTMVDIIEPEAAGAPRRYYFRLDGSHLAALSGIDYTRRYLDELPWPDYRDFIAWTYERVLKNQSPLGYRRRGDIDDHLFDEETIILPLGAGRDRIEKLMVAVIPGDFGPGEHAIVL